METAIQHEVQDRITTLESQLREMYGRAAYTHKTHEKMADSYVLRYRIIKTLEIVISALATGSLILAVFGDSKPATISGAFFSTFLLGLNLYFKEAALGEQAQKHTVVASKLSYPSATGSGNDAAAGYGQVSQVSGHSR